jgi:hypothetical protein
MPEIECPQCGHRALSVATRCPRCGHEFPPNLIQPLPSTAERHWVRWSVMGAVALALILVVGRFGRDESASNKSPRPEATPVVVADTTPRDSVRRDTLPEKAPAPKPAPTPPQPQQSPPPERRSAVAPSAAPAAPAAPSAAGLEQRYATVFVNVRRSRSPSATTTAVLQPGEAVLVDSLRRGWYRITRDGRVLGYADRRFLSTTPR